jgi:large subunit ribosomal protein L13
MKTYSPKAAEIERKWLVVNAEGQTLGRLASEVASILRGKHKPTFAPHMDTGDYVIVINASKIHLTGKKLTDKFYHYHTGYPGGIKSIAYGTLLEKKPEKVIELAVKGMLPHNKLGSAMFKKLKVYAGSEHPHEAQQPQEYKVIG